MSHKDTEPMLAPTNNRRWACDMIHEGALPKASVCINAAFYTLALCDECLAKLKNEILS